MAPQRAASENGELDGSPGSSGCLLPAIAAAHLLLATKLSWR